ncbi:HHP4, partial [Symbiodinium pilosum]
AFSVETASTRGEWSTPVLLFGGLSALWPTVHWLLICHAGREAAGAWLLLVIVAGSLAALVYSRSIPERYRPGRFDLVGNSHQLWHVLIYAAVAAYSEALVTVFALTASASFCV